MMRSIRLEDGAIRPFQVDVPQEDLDDLRRRIAATRWPEKETVADQSQGVQLATMQELVRYWGNEYDLRRFEARLNAFPQFLTEIDGLDIHFIHVKSPHENALPLIITHGWPGSVIEMLNVDRPAQPTRRPTAATRRMRSTWWFRRCPATGSPASRRRPAGAPSTSRDAWITLMERLGYTRYVAQGGDWGAQITDVMGAEAPAGAARHPLQHARHGPARRRRRRSHRTSRRRRPAAVRSVGRRATRVRPAELPLHQGHRLRARDGAAPADVVRARRFARRPRRVDARPRRAQLRGHRRAPSTATQSATSPGTRSSTTSR